MAHDNQDNSILHWDTENRVVIVYSTTNGHGLPHGYIRVRSFGGGWFTILTHFTSPLPEDHIQRVLRAFENFGFPVEPNHKGSMYHIKNEQDRFHYRLKYH